MRKLETLLDDFAFESLPPAWSTFDLARFSKSKNLWDYQQTAQRNAVKALWKYYQDVVDFDASESASGNAARKVRMMEWYLENRVPLEPYLPLGKKRENATLLSAYYPVDEDKIPYEQFINRMGFWMATGSGKTLVIVKLIEVLWCLMRRGEVPAHDILVLTHREDLIKQLRDHVDDYNAGGGELYIRLEELREYPEIKREYPSLLGHQEITVFFYRSDNLSDEQKERIVDFRNYDNAGRWYILLDEAHKGDKEDSKRQHIYSIMSRNGFLFNFSATFTDDRDKLTTAAEFNLSSFIQAGYGKHVSILKQENRAFRRDEDFTDEEKQRIVLQSLLMLAYVSKARESLVHATNAELYHRPLLIALVNSVNTDDADLKLFFAQLVRIARGRVGESVFRRAKADLGDELRSAPEWLYEGDHFTVDQAVFDGLSVADLMRYVFNAETPGEIEVLIRPSNEKELAFKLKSSDAPFALIRIGDTRSWRKDMLADYTFVEGFEDESFFERINADDTEITLLMGSRSFYEGWDSNRPNVITFINIGVGAEAKKFVLQSVGRGVRIEPVKNKRRRLGSLNNAGEVDHTLFQYARPFLPAVETLFIFGTNRAALESVFEELDQEKERQEGTEIALEKSRAAEKGRTFLVPTYRKANLPVIEQRAPRKFELPQAELDYLGMYLDFLGDERLLVARHDLSLRQIGYVEKSIADPQTYFNTEGGRRFGSANILLPRLVKYLDIFPREVEGFKPLEDEINHYRHIRVLLKDIEELRMKIKAVQDSQALDEQRATLKERYLQGKLDFEGFAAAIEGLGRLPSEETFTPPHGAPLKIKNIAAHYYVPLLLSEDEKIDYINHIVHFPSEVAFIRQLEEYLREPGNLFAAFDWWMFSRTDETLDRVVIPYYDPTQNSMREFHPDFIFWLKRWANYYIAFVDPKGMGHTDHQHKIDGYTEIFMDHATGALRELPYQGMIVRVSLSLHATDANQAPLRYKDFWLDHPKDILKRLIPN